MFFSPVRPAVRHDTRGNFRRRVHLHDEGLRAGAGKMPPPGDDGDDQEKMRNPDEWPFHVRSKMRNRQTHAQTYRHIDMLTVLIS